VRNQICAALPLLRSRQSEHQQSFSAQAIAPAGVFAMGRHALVMRVSLAVIAPSTARIAALAMVTVCKVPAYAWQVTVDPAATRLIAVVVMGPVQVILTSVHAMQGGQALSVPSSSSVQILCALAMGHVCMVSVYVRLDI